MGLIATDSELVDARAGLIRLRGETTDALVAPKGHHGPQTSYLDALLLRADPMHPMASARNYGIQTTNLQRTYDLPAAVSQTRAALEVVTGAYMSGAPSMPLVESRTTPMPLYGAGTSQVGQTDYFS
jgi:hypothetical protein